jgi:hypothetical protein
MVLLGLVLSKNGTGWITGLFTMKILLIVIAVALAGFIAVNRAIRHAPVVDDDGHERAAAREEHLVSFEAETLG